VHTKRKKNVCHQHKYGGLMIERHRIFWTQDAVLYAQIVILETQLFLVVEFNRLIVPKFVKS